MNLLRRTEKSPFDAPLSPFLEMGAYEALWLEKGASFKRIADKFRDHPFDLPSDFVSPEVAEECASKVLDQLARNNVKQFGVRINHAGDYPKKLRDARHPIELLYFRGAWELSETKSVAVVGSRKVSEDGIKRTERLVWELGKRGYTIVSGLAAGVDGTAHKAALSFGYPTIAVVGTPLGDIYPKEHAALQEEIAANHLLISQIPILRYQQQDWRINRGFFPERNATMSALTDATIIVEASDTSGTLTQARHALYQTRKLFILNSCFERSDISWPEQFEKKGAIRVRTPDDIWTNLEQD